MNTRTASRSSACYCPASGISSISSPASRASAARGCGRHPGIFASRRVLAPQAALWSLRAVGRHEDPYGLAQKSLVPPGNPASRASAVRGSARSPGTSTGTGPLPEAGSAPQRARRVGTAQVCSQLAVHNAPGLPCRTHGRLPAAPPRRRRRSATRPGRRPRAPVEKPGADCQQRLLRLVRVQRPGAGAPATTVAVLSRTNAWNSPSLERSCCTRSSWTHRRPRRCIHAGTLQAMLVEVPSRRLQDAPDALGIAWPAAVGAWEADLGAGHRQI